VIDNIVKLPAIFFEEVLPKRTSVLSSPKTITYEGCFSIIFYIFLLNRMQCVDVGENCHQRAVGSFMRGSCQPDAGFMNIDIIIKQQVVSCS
jgi:hypothetical protein